MGDSGLGGIEARIDIARFRVGGTLVLIALDRRGEGRAVGGCRIRRYDSDATAVADAGRLAAAMTEKCLLAELPFRGGKAVVAGDPAKAKIPELWRCLGAAIESLDGRFYTGEDVGMERADLESLARHTRYVLGTERGGSAGTAEMTARGTLLAIKAAVRQRVKALSLNGCTIAVQGLGHVGMRLTALLAEENAQLIVADLDARKVAEAVARYSAKPAQPDEIFERRVDVFVPCALGGILTPETVDSLRCAAIAGAANNQLSHPTVGDRLHARGILYAPDVIANAGGVINVTGELDPGGYDRSRALQALRVIERRLVQVFAMARAEGKPPHRIVSLLTGRLLARALVAA